MHHRRNPVALKVFPTRQVVGLYKMKICPPTLHYLWTSVSFESLFLFWSKKNDTRFTHQPRKVNTNIRQNYILDFQTCFGYNTKAYESIVFEDDRILDSTSTFPGASSQSGLMKMWWNMQSLGLQAGIYRIRCKWPFHRSTAWGPYLFQKVLFHFMNPSVSNQIQKGTTEVILGEGPAELTISY